MLISQNVVNVQSDEMPYEATVREMFGDKWRESDNETRDGAWGVAIAKSVADGIRPNEDDLEQHLKENRKHWKQAFSRLLSNQVLRRPWILGDMHNIKNNDPHTLGYYAGYAAGLVKRCQ